MLICHKFIRELSVLIVDSHCHLNMKGIKENLSGVLENAKKNNVKFLQTICTHLDEFDEIYDITQQYPNVVCSVGMHPCDVQNFSDFTVEQLIERARLDKVVALGETGLDYYHDQTHKTRQQEYLIKHIEAAKITGLPLIIHSRDADQDTVDILEKYIKLYGIKGVIHCFTGSKWMCEKMLDLGFYISISGIVTFKNSTILQDIVRDIPLNRLLIETDAPYLAPVPFRGKTNEPGYVYEVLKFIAKMKEISDEEFAEITTRNYFSLFTKAEKFLQDI